MKISRLIIQGQKFLIILLSSGMKLKKIKDFFEDIKNIILQAVSFNANYVVRPKWSLSN
ncbi:MAG: hypothetical protein IPJ23_01415 [Ignavibacteriales bacterium]|nr:hypothetical protein [Ignavibacteriales bacterium]